MPQLDAERPAEATARAHREQRVGAVVLELADDPHLVGRQLAQHREERRVDPGRRVAVHRGGQQVQVALAQRRAEPHAAGQRLGREADGGRAPPPAGDGRHPLAEIAERPRNAGRDVGQLAQRRGHEHGHRAQAAAEPAAGRELPARAQHQIADRAGGVPHRLSLSTEDHRQQVTRSSWRRRRNVRVSRSSVARDRVRSAAAARSARRPGAGAGASASVPRPR